jgi:TIR domain
VTSQYEKDFFVTYNRNDHEWAGWIAATLEDGGYRVIIQAWDFRPGDNVMSNMNDALTMCRHTIGVISPHYLTSVYAQAESTAAYRQAIEGKACGFIPVRIAQCDIGPLLGPLAYIDLVDIDEAEARARLLEGVAERGSRPTAVPPFPGRPRS